jgi:hypothetical protein
MLCPVVDLSSHLMVVVVVVVGRRLVGATDSYVG